ncbi:uncharacterized protein EAE97_001998 [Botrytis byssoidea]|uniref:Uncharacterized protein n=1 Tax=Botrytis byssoidea TaxID=139641 RepID=A0A9P5M5T7_9HELO|nr:uncharacterized protein EAE97_001998 [Botrytis byssoidea]KAF7952501.1 hypothetical protein EAE97_001998 [Botrytis byssoidea]
MGSKNPIDNTFLAMRPFTTAFFEKKKVAGNVIPAMQPPATSSLNKDKIVNNAALVMRPSAAAFFKKDKTTNPFLVAAAKHKPQPIVDLNELTEHPAIAILGDKEITIYIEMCKNMDTAPTDMVALRTALADYKTIKKLSIKIHAPWPHSESKETYNIRVSSMKKLFAIIDGFNLYKLKVTMSVDKVNFPQMKLGAAIHGLRFKKWQLFYQVFDEVNDIEKDPIQIFRGSEYDLRLRGVWKKEFLTQV